MRNKFIDNFKSFYLIGIGGVSMSGLAKYLLSQGKRVGGSDLYANEFCAELTNSGVQIDYGDSPCNVDNYDLIVYTDAISDTDLRLTEAKTLKKPIISRGQLLYEISRNFKKVIAVSGCHGKTTCTAMLMHIFASADKKFAAHVGGKDAHFSNFYYCGNEYFITEACEYKRNFLLLKPNVAVILNSEADHIECYGSEKALIDAYVSFAESANVCISLYADLPIPTACTFGFDKSADYHARNIKMNGGRCSFSVYESGAEGCRVELNVFGRHNVLNALAAAAVARSIGISFSDIRKGLETFSGVERRFEFIGEINGAICIADYAHHPGEISATIKTARKLTAGRLFVIFQPHTYSRTRLLFREFLRVLAPLNNLLIYKTFAAREYYDDAGSALTLSQSLKKSYYGNEPQDVYDFILRAEKGDVVLFLGAGDIYYIAKGLLKPR